MVYRAYDAYAAVGSKAGGSGMGLNGFQQFTDDCRLVRKKSKFNGKTHFDQLFLQVSRGSFRVDIQITGSCCLDGCAVVAGLVTHVTPEDARRLDELSTHWSRSHLQLMT